ncbi:DUF6748 domain-containing protein [Aquabacterium parvum]|jgi:hypothetical protein|uniref:DUF6748 domain-containing protein n=1 Tax=Aquabacterium parvum TaxID=70584 RepID=UPI000718BB9E|nr:DUF6748 domain-containing protein [Aquabacterium parvum]MBU0914748.1 hypothetical protein [Gammaproteobacteria bacterium]
MNHVRTLVATVAMALSALSHAQSTPVPGTDPGTPSTAIDAKSEPYLIVTRVDARKCAYPVCGGYFVKAVNSPVTRCADGKLAKECHAVELDTRALGWSDEQRATFEASFSQGKALVKGAIEPQPRGLYTGEVLRVSEAWQAQGSNKRPLGTFFSLKNNGIVCIQAPCPAFGLQTLNRTSTERSIDTVDFSTARAPDTAVQAAWQALENGPILAAGAVVRFPGFSPTGANVYAHKLVTSEFYLPAKP